jgi:glycosyltransferase involved in cell wall biosynthesis
LTFLIILFVFVVSLQIAYYGILFAQFSFVKKQRKENNKPPISIIIACKNEAKNLQSNLSSFITQDYPLFEIVIINDASTDDTPKVIKEFASVNKHIQFIDIPFSDTYSGNKKNAVTKGIKVAKYNHLLFTDADCLPKSKKWIIEMSAYFSDQKQMILGYGAYKKTSGWLNKLVRYETFLTAWQYFSYTLIGMPYMGVGRNMGYTKQLFKDAEGFKRHQKVQSGVDDLFVNQIGTKNNISLNWFVEAHTVSQPKETLNSWLHQKRRHITTATSYKKSHQILLGLFYLSQVAFIVLIPFLIIWSQQLMLVLIAISLRYFVFFLALIPATKKLQESDLIILAPFLELFLILLQLRIFIANLIKKPTTW